MAHLERILSTESLKRKLCCYKEIKVLKFSIDKNVEPSCCREGSSNKWKRIIYLQGLRTYGKKFRTPNTIENAVWQSFLGFCGGVVATYILFLFFYLGLGFSSRVSTHVCMVVGVPLSLGLAFSESVRCYFLLVLPVLFLQQGREGLLAFILFLAVTGPAKTTMKNMNILTVSMSCRQEIIRKTLIQILDMGSTPFKSTKETIQRLTKTSQEVSEKIKLSFICIKRPIFGVLNAIMKASYWLKSNVDLCNRKLGSPFQRCMRAFEDSIADCKAKLGVMDFLCHVVHLVKSLCYSVKNLDFLCVSTEHISDKFTSIVKNRVKEFSLKMKNLFYISIDFGQPSDFQSFPANSTSLQPTNLEKLNAAMENIEIAYIFFIFFLTFFLVYVSLKVYYYKYKYLSSDQFDNLYINKYIIELDLRRALLNKETVLPLEPREEKLFAKATSLRLLRKEKIRMAKSICLLTVTTFKIITFVMLDYTLFWTLSTIYNAGYNEFQGVEKSEIVLHVEGEGVVADFFRNLGKTFYATSELKEPLNSFKCLPDPETPNTQIYIQIGFCMTLCWIFTLTEAYGLRLRNVIMSYYYPDRARERAVWLYNHILFSRGSFVKFARRQLKRKFQKSKDRRPQKMTLNQKFYALASKVPMLGHFILRQKDNICLSCGTFETQWEPLKRCQTSKCPGKYCVDCFVSMQNLCMICQRPIGEEEFTDTSDEGDSSEEEEYTKSRHGFIGRSSKKTRLSSALEHEEDSEEKKKTEYARLSDLYNQKMDVRQRIKSAILKRIRSIVIKKKENKTQSKKNASKRVKLKLQDLLRKLSGRKSLAPDTNQKVLDELYKMKQENLDKTEVDSSFIREENLSSTPGLTLSRSERSNSLPRSKSERISSLPHGKFEKDNLLPRSTSDYDKLKNDVKGRIKFLLGLKKARKKTLSSLPESEEKSGNTDSVKTSSKSTNAESEKTGNEGTTEPSTEGKASEPGISCSLSKFWESKNAKFGFTASESEANFLNPWAGESCSGRMLEFRGEKSETDEMWPSQAQISTPFADLNKIVYPLKKVGNSFDVLFTSAPESSRSFDVNFRTFVCKEYEDSEDEDFVL